MIFFLEQIPELGNTSASQLICFFGYYIIDIQKKESFFPKDIDNCFQMAQISPYSNIPSFLSTKSKGKNSIFIKNKNGSYTLQRKLREEINVKIGLPKKNGSFQQPFSYRIINRHSWIYSKHCKSSNTLL